MILAYKLVWKTAFIKSLLKTAAIICIYNIVVFQAEPRPGTFKLFQMDRRKEGSVAAMVRNWEEEEVVTTLSEPC